jgi:glycopeptide antibiotics resistance protein
MIEIRVYATSVAGSIPLEVYLALLGLFVIGLLVMVWWKGLGFGLHYCSALLLVEWALLILCATVIFRETGAERGCNLIPFWSYFDYGKHSYFMEMFGENILNVLLFVPVGFLAGCGFQGVTFKKVLLLGGGFSIFIELLQFIFMKGFCETDDVIHNVAGCLIGYALWLHLGLPMVISKN